MPIKAFDARVWAQMRTKKRLLSSQRLALSGGGPGQ
jgi:hypothetical protein